MKQKIAVIVVLGMMLTSFTGCGNTNGDLQLEKLDDASLSQSVDETAHAFFEEEEPVGLAVGILKDGAAAYWNDGLKSKDGDPVTENTYFEIASVSKTMAGILLGTLDADPDSPVSAEEAVSKLVPELEIPDYEGDEVQWWHLSSHVSGLPRLPDNFEDGQNPYADYTAEDLQYYLSEQAHLYTRPGENYLYSNLGVGLMGYALSTVTEMPYEQLLQERVLNPLGMSSTAITLTAEQEAERAMPHTKLGTQVSQWDFDVLAACGGVKSTTHDLLLYLAANMGQIPFEGETLKQGMEAAQ